MQYDHSTLITIGVVIALALGFRAFMQYLNARETRVPTGDEKPPVLVRTYKGSPAAAAGAFHSNAPAMAEEGYFPVSQSYTPGSYSGGDFLFALLLCLVLIGILVFIYMLIVKPPGALQVTYELRVRNAAPAAHVPGSEKVCPRCAETVKGAAKVCRYCGHEFSLEAPL